MEASLSELVKLARVVPHRRVRGRDRSEPDGLARVFVGDGADAGEVGLLVHVGDGARRLGFSDVVIFHRSNSNQSPDVTFRLASTVAFSWPYVDRFEIFFLRTYDLRSGYKCNKFLLIWSTES